MPDTNIEILRRGIEAFNARDIEGIIGVFEPDAELHSAFATAMSGVAVYRGHDGIREWHRDLEETWSQIHLTLKQVFERGEHLLALYEMHGRGRQSEAEVAMPVAHLMRMRNGRVPWLRTYTDPEAARRDFEKLAPAAEETRA